MRKLILASLFATTALAVPRAHAVLQLSLDVQGSIFSCADGQACDTNGAAGILQVNNQTINGVTINGSVQSADLAARVLNTSSLSITNNSGPLSNPDLALFSMTETAHSLLVNGGSIVNRGQTEIKDVTEPASLALLGMSVLGLGMIRSRRS